MWLHAFDSHIQLAHNDSAQLVIGVDEMSKKRENTHDAFCVCVRTESRPIHASNGSTDSKHNTHTYVMDYGIREHEKRENRLYIE